MNVLVRHNTPKSTITAVINNIMTNILLSASFNLILDLCRLTTETVIISPNMLIYLNLLTTSSRRAIKHDTPNNEQ